MIFTQKVRFVVRQAGHGFCDIAGNPTQKPVVYLVPVEYFRSTISGNLKTGLTTHDFDDYTGQHYAVNAEFFRGERTFRTGNPTSWGY